MACWALRTISSRIQHPNPLKSSPIALNRKAMDPRIHINELIPAASENEYQIHCAALEWSLAEPIIINSAQDMKSVANWQDRVKPFRHQMENLIRFCRRLPVTLLADDVGLGKTISAGLILSELMSRGRVSRTFVVCPKILIPQWVEELQSKFGIEAYGGSGREVASFDRRREPVLVTTYQSATELLQRQDPNLFDMLILDEAHKVRNLFGTNSKPKMALSVFGALQARMFKYVLMLTATPIQNRLWDIYSLIECLAVAKGHRNPLGSPDNFSQRYLADGKNKARQLRPDTAGEFRDIIGNYMYRTRRMDANLAFPERRVRSYEVVPENDEIELQNLIAQNIHLFTPLLQMSVLVALMSSPPALASQLRNMASKNADYQRLSEKIDAIVRQSGLPAKISAVRQVVEVARNQKKDWRLVIFTTRKETQDMIGRVLSEDGVTVGYIRGGQPDSNNHAIIAFREDVPRVNVLISTDAGAEGVNLQAANVLINYDLPWNPMIVEQRIGRVQRIGSRFKEVWIANVVHANSPEQQIVARLMEKLQVISHTVGDIEAVLDASGDSNGDSFELRVRDMVIASLQGQDMKQAACRAERSIEEARGLFEERRTEMDSQLGKLDDKNSDDLPMPELSKRSPEPPLPIFVHSALKAEGADITNESTYIFRAIYGQQHQERFTFEHAMVEKIADSGVFMGRRPVLYQPGKPAFERLVQRWLDRGQAYVIDDRISLEAIEHAAASWVSQIEDARLDSCELIGDIDSLSGELVVLARAANAIDRYEKLMRITFDNVSGADVEIGKKSQTEAIVRRVSDHIVRAVSLDADLNAFQKYYASRLQVESAKSEAGDRLQKLQNDLKPCLHIEVVGLRGRISGGEAISISYSVDGKEIYTSRIPLKNGKVADAPKCAICQVTGRFVPLDAMAQCAISGTQALRHKLASSALSGVLVLPEFITRCEETNRCLLESETDVCSLTGRRVGKDLLVVSDVTGRKALASRSLRCDFTRAVLLDDEIAVSDRSGRVFHRDESVTVPSTGQVVHNTEVCRCEETDELLIEDQVARCSLSGMIVNKDLLARCQETGAFALERLLQTCEETGGLFVPDRMTRCEITRKRVRRTLVDVSEESGRVALKSHFVKCDITGLRLMKDEVAICEVTGKSVNKRHLRRCARSGKVALRDKLVKSVVSNKYFLPEFTITIANDKRAADNEVTWCFWRSGYIPNEIAAKCELTGLTFARKLLNASGELAVLRACLDGARSGDAFPDQGFLMRSHPGVFRGVKDVCWVRSKGGGGILFGKRSTLGLFANYFGVVVQYDESKFILHGRAVFGKRTGGIWHISEHFEMNSA